MIVCSMYHHLYCTYSGLRHNFGTVIITMHAVACAAAVIVGTQYKPTAHWVRCVSVPPWKEKHFGRK